MEVQNVFVYLKLTAVSNNENLQNNVQNIIKLFENVVFKFVHLDASFPHNHFFFLLFGLVCGKLKSIILLTEVLIRGLYNNSLLHHPPNRVL